MPELAKIGALHHSSPAASLSAYRATAGFFDMMCQQSGVIPRRTGTSSNTTNTPPKRFLRLLVYDVPSLPAARDQGSPAAAASTAAATPTGDELYIAFDVRSLPMGALWATRSSPDAEAVHVSGTAHESTTSSEANTTLQVYDVKCARLAKSVIQRQ